jgi:PadR family transcriptional regulator, regulatory protein PadR
MSRQTPLLQGTLDVLILKALSLEPLHGLGVSRRVGQITRGAYVVRPGSLFPALHRLEERGWVQGSWGESANNRRAKFYELTAAGRKQLRVESGEWRRVALAIDAALEAT